MKTKRIGPRIVVVLTYSLLLAVLLIANVTVVGQGGKGLSVQFTPYEGAPVIPRGEKGAWDYGYVAMGRVMYADGLFHMFFIGGENALIRPSAVGYATSVDGVTWTKYEDNPVLELDEARAPYGFFWPVPVLQEDTWVLYLNPRILPGFGSSGTVLRATAPAPTGPWTVEYEPVLEQGGDRDWDNVYFFPDSWVSLEGGEARLFYTAGPLGEIGVASSPDGMTWTRYDDPETDTPRYRNSDPIFVNGERGRWDDGAVGSPSVLLGEHGWEMFYLGAPYDDPNDGSAFGVGYATSEDGITWTRDGNAPILTLGPDAYPNAPSVVVVDETYYLYYSIIPFGESYFAIGLATGTITRGEVKD